MGLLTRWIRGAVAAVAFVGALALYASSPAQDRGRLNIIFIHATDLGYGDVGSHGQQKISTPPR